MNTPTNLYQQLFTRAIDPAIRLSVSPHFHNKDNIALKRWNNRKNRNSNDYAFGYEWQSVQMPLPQIVEHITRGKPISVASLSDDHRDIDSFVSSQIIGIDFDFADYTDVLKHPFVRQYAFFVGATAKHTPEKPRCRAYFALDCPITDPIQYSIYVQRITHFLEQYNPDKLPDAVRLFYGSTQPHYHVDYERLLPLKVLEKLPDVPQKPTPEYSPTPAELSNMKPVFGNDSLYAAIENRLGVTGYQTNGYSYPVRCPVVKHEHDDTAPAAHWHTNKKIFRCFKCCARGDSYRLATNIASYLGLSVQLHPVTGLHTSIRQSLLNYRPGLTIKGTPRRDSAIENAARIIDLLYMTGHRPGSSITERQLSLWCAEFGIGMRTVRSALSAKIQGKSIFVTLCHPDRAVGVLYLKEEGQNDTKISRGKGRPSKAYIIPDESELARLLNVSIRGRVKLKFDDLKTPKAYRQALNRSRLERQKGKPIAVGILADNIGVTKRTVRRYIRSDNTITPITNTAMVQVITRENVEAFNWDDYGEWGVWLQTEVSESGYRYAPNRHRALSLLEHHPELYLYRQLANSYQLEQIAKPSLEIVELPGKQTEKLPVNIDTLNTEKARNKSDERQQTG